MTLSFAALWPESLYRVECKFTNVSFRSRCGKYAEEELGIRLCPYCRVVMLCSGFQMVKIPPN